MAWKIEISPKADKDLEKLSPDARSAILNYLFQQVLTCDHPSQLGKPLKHEFSGLWRYRVGKYRIICRLEREELVVFVVKVAKRDKVYD